jgi:hypothetical protein
MAPRPILKHYIFFITYDWAKQAKELDYIMLERLANGKHSSLLTPFTSSEENDPY